MRAEDAELEMRRISRRSFLWAAGTLAGGFGAWEWLTHRPDADGIPAPLRSVLGVNESMSRRLFSEGHRAAEYPVSLAGLPKVNGQEGLSGDEDPTEWHFEVHGLAAGREPLRLSLAEIRALPKRDLVTELRCIEGWSKVVHWAGAPFAAMVAKYRPSGGAAVPQYVSIETPDGDYYVGLDLASALHPQTLLCYEMGGRPLTPEHGAPLRLVIPVKYGVKNLKRIGKIRFTDERPPDFWAEQGYDWYAGL